MIEKRRHLLLSILLVLSTSLIISCATIQKDVYHGTIMKGAIIETSGSEVYLCIGKKDGAMAGQILAVYKIVSNRGPKEPPNFRREYTGKVKIKEIIDDHFATADVIEGVATQYSIVELER